MISDVLDDSVQEDIEGLRLGCRSGGIQAFIGEGENGTLEIVLFPLERREGLRPRAGYRRPILLSRVIARFGGGKPFASNPQPGGGVEDEFPDAMGILNGVRGGLLPGNISEERFERRTMPGGTLIHVPELTGHTSSFRPGGVNIR